MDHLATDQERRKRWYSNLWPRYIPVVISKDWEEALAQQDVYSCVRSVPMDWVLQGVHSNELLRLVLAEHGFVVISGVLSESECRNALSLAWDYLEAASVAEHELSYHAALPNNVTPPPLRRTAEMSSTRAENMPRSVEGGMLPYYGSGHSTLAWFIRSHPRVRDIFAALYQTDNLISSLDGMVLWLQESRTDAGWFHMDQHPICKPQQCGVQGLVNLLPVTEATGGNVLVAHSHKHFPHNYTDDNKLFYKERMEEVGIDDWLEVDPNDAVVLQPQHLLSCLLNPGDALLWDSRVVHCSYPGKEGAQLPELWKEAHGMIRAGVMVSMMPAEQVSQEVLRQRTEAVHQSRTLTHWTDKVAPLGEEHPDQVAMEVSCVENMRAWQDQQGTKVLLGYEDLSPEQRHLVAGKSAG